MGQLDLTLLRNMYIIVQNWEGGENMPPISIGNPEKAQRITVKDGVVDVDLHGGVTAKVTSTPKGGTITEERQHSDFANYYLDVDAPDCRKVEIDGVVFEAKAGQKKA